MNIVVPSDDIDSDPEFNATTPTKLHRQIQSCKERLWKRWHDEYLLALRERHRCTKKAEQTTVNVGDVMQIKGKQKNRGEWRIGIVTKVVKINDVIVGAKLKLGTGIVLERPIEFLYPLELHSEQPTITDKQDEVREMKRERPLRKAKVVANEKLSRMIKELNDEF